MSRLLASVSAERRFGTTSVLPADGARPEEEVAICCARSAKSARISSRSVCTDRPALLRGLSIVPDDSKYVVRLSALASSASGAKNTKVNAAEMSHRVSKLSISLRLRDDRSLAKPIFVLSDAGHSLSC